MPTKTTRSLNVPCPNCGASGAVKVDLNDLDQFQCGDCDQDFERSEIDNLIAKWTKALAWIDAAPVEE